MNETTESCSISIDEVKMSEIVLQREGQQLLLILSILLPLQVKGEAVTGLCSMEGSGGRRAQHNDAAAKSCLLQIVQRTQILCPPHQRWDRSAVGPIC
jgi:hypothetical protein